MEQKVLNVLGKEVSSLTLNSSVFAIKPHNQSMFDLVLQERAKKRQGTKKTKTVSEVRGGGKKPWKQKHTGRARHGSIRSPIWKGGGVAHGPTPEKKYTFKLNKKVVKLAFKSGWSLKAKENALVLVDKISFRSPSTKDFHKMIKNLDSDVKRVLVVISPEEKDFNTYLSGRNLTNVCIATTQELFLEDILKAKKIIMTTDVLTLVEGGLK